jgi:hypothetical protein
MVPPLHANCSNAPCYASMDNKIEKKIEMTLERTKYQFIVAGQILIHIRYSADERFFSQHFFH